MAGVIEAGENGIGHEWREVRLHPGVGQLDVELRASRYYQGEADQLSAVESRRDGHPGNLKRVTTLSLRSFLEVQDVAVPNNRARCKGDSYSILSLMCTFFPKAR